MDDMMGDMAEEWRQELIEAGEISPDDDLSPTQIMIKYQDYQMRNDDRWSLLIHHHDQNFLQSFS